MNEIVGDQSDYVMRFKRLRARRSLLQSGAIQVENVDISVKLHVSLILSILFDGYSIYVIKRSTKK